MSVCALGQLVERQTGTLGELLQDEELRPAQADLAFRATRRLTQRLKDPPDGVENLTRAGDRL